LTFAATLPTDAIAWTPALVKVSVTSDAGTFASVKLPAASAGALTFVPWTPTTIEAAGPDGLATVPLIVAPSDTGDGTGTAETTVCDDGAVGEAECPPHAVPRTLKNSATSRPTARRN
jgi:hypothetical protein